MNALVIDDHAITHIGCRLMLKECGFDSIHEARTEEEGYQLAESHNPQIIILDLTLPGPGGLAMIPRLLARAEASKILIFSMHDDPIMAARALEAGAHGYLTKTSRPEDLITAVNSILDGEIYLEQSLAEKLATMKSGRRSNPLSNLSSREYQILQCIGQGLRHGEIADKLHVSYKTVANIASILKTKLGASSLSDLMRIAIEIEQEDG